jgi:hypothetical protein
MNKKNYIYLILGLVLLILIIVFSSSKADLSQNNKDDIKVTGNSILGTKFTGSLEPGDVRIDLTPLELNDKILKIEISANTHSVDLSQFNLKEITTLEYNGKSINPSSELKLSGHHSRGILVFNLDEKPDNFVIKIKGIPKTKERIFTWD